MANQAERKKLPCLKHIDKPRIKKFDSFNNKHSTPLKTSLYPSTDQVDAYVGGSIIYIAYTNSDGNFISAADFETSVEYQQELVPEEKVMKSGEFFRNERQS
ncbi:unnamed protein product [Prunus armeniaca]|uniref:Uncharacterized protein n=1 Tax=Prunus armeniaca TaxID=36596 RepID=A0A6J5WXE5_PRUAR|nr:unnamed protein product [Prunus armeniaca]